MTGLRVVILIKTNNGGNWLIPETLALRDRGHQPIVVLPAGGRLTSRLAEHGIETVESPFDFRFRPTPATVRGLWRLRRLLRRLHPDVLNYHLYAAAIAARIASLGLPVRRVHTVVGPLFLESRIVRPVERLLVRLDDVVLCGTEYTSRLYADLGVPAPRRPAVTCGTDTTRFRPTDPEPGPTGLTRAEQRSKDRADLGIPQQAFLVVMVAYVYPPRRLAHRGQAIKGHDVLLAAWRLFRARHTDAHLLLVGGGWTGAGEAHRRDLIGRFGVADDPSVTWLESLSDVRPAYRAADLSVSPSRSEGHGAAVEAHAMAVPSIVSDAGGLPETVDGASGWVVPRDDVPALAAALECAYQEFRAGTLECRGDLARQLTVRLFDSRSAAARIVGIIEDTTAPGQPAGAR
jgi:glycosyltransferase involved in cell wall biosynthesis